MHKDDEDAHKERIEERQHHREAEIHSSGGEVIGECRVVSGERLQYWGFGTWLPVQECPEHAPYREALERYLAPCQINHEHNARCAARLMIPGGPYLLVRRQERCTEFPGCCCVCGWRLEEKAEQGCVENNCARRPRPKSAYCLKCNGTGSITAHDLEPKDE